MPVPITVPRLGWTMDEGVFLGWLKQDGDHVRAGEPLFTLEAEKATQEIEATDSGILRISPDAPSPGSTVKVGTELGHLLTEAEARLSLASSGPAPKPDLNRATPSASPVAPEEPSAAPKIAPDRPEPAPVLGAATALAPAPGREIRISPRAARAAARLGVDWATVRGTGRTGRIRERDILAVAAPVASREQLRAVITDWTFADLSIEQRLLESRGVSVVGRPCRTEEELIALVADADAVITQFAKLSARVIQSMSRARVIVRYGIGVDNVDLEAARAAGIPVCNVPDYCIDEVADHTLSFILGLTRQVVTHTVQIRQGQWGLAVPLDQMRALSRLTVGVAGFGRIGREVVKRLLPFRCRVLVCDPAVDPAAVRAAGAEHSSWDETLAAADILTLHCPSTARTRRMMSAEAFGRMKAGALFINVARGDLVDTAALVAALESGRLAGAALDVCDPEPIPAGHPLLRRANVILAPHIASASPSAVQKLRETVVELAVTALRGEPPPNVVNNVTLPRAI